MKIFNHKAFAVVLTVLVSLGALTFGVHRSVGSEAADVAKLYTTGVDGSGYGIAGDLADRMEYAGVLQKLGQKYTDTSAVSEAIGALDAAEGPAAQYDANAALQDAVTALDLSLQDAALSSQDEKNRAEYISLFSSCADTISHEAPKYNKQVAEFESKVLTGLPVRLFGSLTALPGVEAFQ